LKDQLMKRTVLVVVVMILAFCAGILVYSIARMAPEQPSQTVVAPTQPVAPPPVPSAAPLSVADLAQSSTLYRKNCQSCHLPSGVGEHHHKKDGIPDFTDSSWKASANPETLFAWVKNGKGSVMPSFGKKLTDDEIRLLVRYVRAFDARAEKPSPSHGEHPSRS